MFKQYVILLLLLSGCKVIPSVVTNGYIHTQKEKRENKQWKLIWEDHFEGNAIDTTRWSKIPVGGSDWNRHMSYHPDCFALKDGKLHLIGINNPDTLQDPRPYLTGGMYTKGKFAYQYGRVEIKAKLESAQGAWPAMWMLAEQDKYGQYPKNGEIDIMEHINFDDIIYQTTHSWYTLELKERKNPPNGSTTPFNKNDFNVFGLEWYPDRLVFTLNGKETFRYPRIEKVDASQWPYDQPFYLMIDQQLGGEWVGEVNRDHLPVQMIVDWVKVYQ